MCLVSNKIKFCTCSPNTDIYELKHYWILHRFVEDKDEMIIGSPAMPPYIEENIEAYNIILLESRLNEPDAFDFDLEVSDKDRLELFFTCEEGKYLHYGFEYYEGTWKEVEFSSFEFLSHYEEREAGRIRQPLKLKSTK